MKAEKIIIAFVVLGLFFKFMHFVGAGPILVVGFSSMAMMYLGGGFYFLQGENEQKRTGLAVVSGIVFGISCIGILFRIMYWPGGKAMLIIPAIALPIMLAIVFYLKGKENQPLETDKKLLIRLLIFSVFAITLYFISNKALLTIQYPNDPEVVRIKSNHFDHPENEAYAKEYHEYIEAQRANRK
jgi:hypothetical protein